ncbi:hypothetical protein [Sanguibacter sp. Leaf3]|uniref:hypothetical protein n=1 Tax=Sanguibacter sp. Leaf3 TaxID=1736209 RepID=UPI0006F5EE84|nr:hypothetical protein [Sanguibacter sp. Leaf3]KQT96745.1 hypothetical protein ASG53_17035 [Sanguibacter sp. Leaf3]
MASPLSELRCLGEPTLAHVDLDLLDRYRFADGGGFPPSYSDLVRRVGWGRTFGLWLVYPPLLPGFADSWQGRAAELTRRFAATYDDGRREDFDWMVEPDGSWELAADLCVFAWSENGDALLWDTGSRGTDGELPVWESRSLDSLHHLGASLVEALGHLSASADALFGPRDHDVEPLPAVRL